MADLESDTAESTESTANTDKFGQAICAFANDLPRHRRVGYLLERRTGSGLPSCKTTNAGFIFGCGRTALGSKTGNGRPDPAALQAQAASSWQRA
ncbi:MAG: hypothetical protein Q7K41_01830 [Dehalococcoidales bacterium]|nr:hypothetical protein [Dehalococcoidales bacterium]